MKFIIIVLSLCFISISQNINAQEITFNTSFLGLKYYQNDAQISKYKVNSLLKQDQEALQLWEKSIKHQTIALLALGGEIGLIIWGASKAKKNEDLTILLAGAIVSAGVVIRFALSSSSLEKRAIRKYNQNLDMGSIDLGLTPNGIGMVVSF